jgi:hypothetical protein
MGGLYRGPRLYRPVSDIPLGDTGAFTGPVPVPAGMRTVMTELTAYIAEVGERVSDAASTERAWFADPAALGESLVRLPEDVRGAGTESGPRRDSARATEKG